MAESIQQKLTRVRPPRVKITYDVETGGAIEKVELPFIVGIFSDLTCDRMPADGDDAGNDLPLVKERKLVEVDRDNFDDVLATARPRVKLGKVANVLPNPDGTPPDGSGALGGYIEFQRFDDFEPMAIVDKVPALKALYQARARLRAFQAKIEASDALSNLADDAVHNVEGEDNELAAALDGLFPAGSDPETWGDVADEGAMAQMLDAMFGKGQRPEDEERIKSAKQMIGQFVTDLVRIAVARGNILVAGRLMDQRVCEIDRALGRQMDLILHDATFRQCEGTWRGMHYLVFNAETGTHLKLRVMNITKAELLKEMVKAPEFDQSHVFKLIYEAEYGTYGGDPYSLLVGDYEFGRDGQSTALLEKMSEVAAASHAPFISAAYAELFDLHDFEDLARPRDLAKIFESVELAAWQSFRESEDSRFVTLAMPRVLMRTPYGEKTSPIEGFAYEENVDMDDPLPEDEAERVQAVADRIKGEYETDVTACSLDMLARSRPKDSQKFCWGNAAFILAERITHAFSLYSWCAAIRGVRGGGLVEGLPLYTYKTAEGDVTMTCPTQVTITDRREKELNDLGFMAICHCKGTTKAAFFGGQTTNAPKKYFSASANANAKLSAMLPYMLAASRFAHYIKVIMRERIGTFMTRANVEAFLNDWIANYVLLDDNAPQEVKAAYPLRAAMVNVTDDPANPGSYKATVFLKPHFQLEELTTSIRLVADLPA